MFCLGQFLAMFCSVCCYCCGMGTSTSSVCFAILCVCCTFSRPPTPAVTVSPCSWNVKTLDLSHNNLSGSIPTSLGSANSLVEVQLSNNRLSGTLPDSFSTLSELDLLDLSYNNLSEGGVLPDWLIMDRWGRGVVMVMVESCSWLWMGWAEMEMGCSGLSGVEGIGMDWLEWITMVLGGTAWFGVDYCCLEWYCQAGLCSSIWWSCMCMSSKFLGRAIIQYLTCEYTVALRFSTACCCQWLSKQEPFCGCVLPCRSARQELAPDCNRDLHLLCSPLTFVGYNSRDAQVRLDPSYYSFEGCSCDASYLTQEARNGSTVSIKCIERKVTA